MLKTIKKALRAVVKAIVHAGFAVWAALTWIAYRPKIVYEDPSVREKLKSEACILAANHTSHHDGSFIPQALCRCKMYVVVTTKWYNKKALHWLFKTLRSIPIDLNNMDSEWMEKSEKALKDGCSVLIFPAGKLVRDGTLGELHPGFLMLAKFTNAPVIPLISRGGYRLFHRQELIVGSEIAFDVHAKGRPSVVMHEGAEVCKEQMEKLLTKQI